MSVWELEETSEKQVVFKNKWLEKQFIYTGVINIEKIFYNIPSLSRELQINPCLPG